MVGVTAYFSHGSKFSLWMLISEKQPFFSISKTSNYMSHGATLFRSTLGLDLSELIK